MFTNDGYALLIGVNDYRTFDISSGQPVGTHDLYGSRNDVKTFWRLCRLIGIKPANIRVLTSPITDVADLEGASPENVALATEAEILEKTGWLAEKLALAGKPTGIFTYSGHGDWLEDQGLVLCPSDVAKGGAGQPELVHAVPFRALNALLAGRAENLTVVLDTCHCGASASPARPGKTGKPLTLTHRPLADHPKVRETGHAPEIEELAGRVLAAARRDQLAYQSLFDGHHRGVFSWAISAAIEQWRATQQGRDNVRVDLSYAKLVEATERLMTALWFDQSPQILGPAGVADLAVLHHGTVVEPGETTSLPDRAGVAKELDPGYFDYVLYSVYDANGNLAASVVVTETAGAGYEANNEYWYLKENLSNGSGILFTAGPAQTWSNPPSNLGKLSFVMSRIASWNVANPRGTFLVYSNPSTGEYDGMNWAMTYTGRSWTGQITWWHNVAATMFGPGTARSMVPTVAGGTHYYSISTPI